MTIAFDDVWVSSYFDGTITRIDPDTEKVVAEITTEQGPQIMAEAGGLLWVSTTDVDAVQAIDPQTNEIVATVDTPVAPDGLAFDGSILWVATEIGPELVGIDVGDPSGRGGVDRRGPRVDQREPGDGVRGRLALVADPRRRHGLASDAARLRNLGGTSTVPGP